MFDGGPETWRKGAHSVRCGKAGASWTAASKTAMPASCIAIPCSAPPSSRPFSKAGSGPGRDLAVLGTGGKEFARARDRAAFLPRRSALTGSRDRKCRFEPRERRGNPEVFPEAAGNRICVGLGGGAGRTQTDHQPIMGLKGPYQGSPFDGYSENLPAGRSHRCGTAWASAVTDSVPGLLFEGRLGTPRFDAQLP